MNRPKVKGTRAETEHVKFLRKASGDDRIDRIALHGTDDRGDVGPIHVGHLRGMAEVKNYKGRPSPGQLSKWKRETLKEKANGGWDFAYLLVHEPGCNLEDHTSPTYGMNRVYMTLQDFSTMAFGDTFEPMGRHAEMVYGTWVQLTANDLVDIMFDDDGRRER